MPSAGRPCAHRARVSCATRDGTVVVVLHWQHAGSMEGQARQGAGRSTAKHGAASQGALIYNPGRMYAQRVSTEFARQRKAQRRRRSGKGEGDVSRDRRVAARRVQYLFVPDKIYIYESCARLGHGHTTDTVRQSASCRGDVGHGVVLRGAVCPAGNGRQRRRRREGPACPDGLNGVAAGRSRNTI